MDPITTVGTGLAVVGSKDLLNKLLGPTADYLGNEARGLVAKCNINLDSIFLKAALKLGERLDSPGSVSPRVLKLVYDDGRFCDNEVAVEYYAGILASSRSENSRDDRGVTLLATIRNLSVYQLRFHYLVYSIVHKLFRGSNFDMGRLNHCKKMTTFIPLRIFENAMDFVETEDANAILGHVLYGLGKHDLISDFSGGPAEFIRKRMPKASEAGILLAPTIPGSELFLWSNGIQGASGAELLRVERIQPITGIKLDEGSFAAGHLLKPPPVRSR